MSSKHVSSSTTRLRAGRACRALAILVVCAVVFLSTAGGAMAAPVWDVRALMNPTATPGEQVTYILTFRNVGDRTAPTALLGDGTNCTAGAPAPPAVPANCYRITARFAAGVTPVSATPISGGSSCVINGGTNTVTCPAPGHTAAQQLAPTVRRFIMITADVAPGATGTLTNTFEISGAGAGTDTTVHPLTVTPAAPDFDVARFDAQVAADASGAALTQAGGHPYSASTAIELNSVTNLHPFVESILFPIEPVKDIVVDLPPGFVGNPTAVDQCTVPELANMREGFGTEERPLCPAASQVGTTTLRHANSITSVLEPIAVYNMVPTPEVPARFGFNVMGTIVLLDAELRSDGDYGITVFARNVSEGLAVQGSEVTLWGVPSDASHNNQRACPGQAPVYSDGPTCASGAAPRPFLRNPTMCTPAGEGLPTTLRVNSWLDTGDVKSRTIESHLPPGYPFAPEDWGAPHGPDGCDRVPFRPELSGQPDVGASAGSPSGFSFDLTLPQSDDLNAPGTSDLRKAVVTLPQGVRVNPSSAGGLAGCSSAQVALDSKADAACPEASKIGSLTIETPLLREPIEGGVYLATPFDNPFDSLIAIYLVAKGQGVSLKLPGHVTPDASKDGQMTATFDDQPQLPFSNLHLEFKGGPRAPIVLPRRCGTYTTRSVMTGWSGRVVESSSSFTIDQGCGGGFRPGFTAGTETSPAGRSSPFVLRLTREDTDEELSGISLDMPSGLTGRISDVTLCPEANAAAGTCTDGSKVGNVTVGAGAGVHPFYITNGRAYLTGPYRGAPFGLSIVVPAVAGPFDLGTVVVRSAVFVDKHTAEVSVVSDPLPTQLQGIPLDVKDVRVSVDREGFWLNPTSCEEKSITGVIESAAGTRAAVSSRFQAYDCAALPLTPRMVLRVGGRGKTQRGRTTPFTATLRQTPGQAGLRRVQVTLPTVINARLTVINDACTRAEYEAGNCEDARTGTATAVTPLLRDPLTGGVYFVRNGNPLPDLFVRLRGQVEFDLIGRITIPGSKRLRTTFDLVPDVPVSSFTLRLDGGREGSVGNAANLCSRRGRRARATLSFTGQNGKELLVRQRLKVGGCRGRGRRGRRARRR